MKNKQKLGIVLYVLGISILVINAADYLSGFFGTRLGIKFISSAIGAIFFIFGMHLAGMYSVKKKSKKKKR
jgi:uncharacterized integral membrane protein